MANLFDHIWTRRSDSNSLRLVVLLCSVFLAQICTPVLVAANTADEHRALLRFPAIGNGVIVFSAGEDLWSVSAVGGIATRLTIHDGSERFPHISPDGSLIAFTGEYDGNSDIYVMSIHGGDITRVTFHPGYDRMVGWHPTSGQIMFASMRQSLSRAGRIFLINTDGTGLEPMIMIEAANGTFSADGQQIAFNKITRESRTWKRYQGGMAQDIFVYDLESNLERQLTDFDGTDRLPMWSGDKIYFSSDRERTLNIFAYDLQTRQTTQITRHSKYDVRRPSLGGTDIVYELGGEIWRLDTTTGRTARVPIEIRADAPEARPSIVRVDDFITEFDCSPGGERALIVARGEVFTVPAENGPTRNLTSDSGANDRAAAWSPDGKTIAYLSDKGGEYEIYLVDAQGNEQSVCLTSHPDGYRHTLRWSPNSKLIAYTDQTLTLYYLDVDSKKITTVDKAEYENVDVSLLNKPISDFTWSPDSRFLAYAKMAPCLLYKVHIHDLGGGRNHCVSTDLFDDFNPTFSPDGEHLFFVSNRRFSPTLCDFEWEMVYKNVAGIYCLTLRRDGPPLLPPRSDEATEPSAAKNKHDKEKEDEKPVKVEIDFEGLPQRIEALPVPAGNYRHLSANKHTLYYLNTNQGDFNRFEYRRLPPMDLHAFYFAERDTSMVVTGLRGYKLSADGSKIVYRNNDGIGLLCAQERDAETENLDLDGLRMELDPRAEWRQIFDEAWRLERDFYYEPDMHGLDWPATGEKYRRLLAYASCRQDVGFLVGELIGELNTSHTYVYGGDTRRTSDNSVSVGLLGADWQADIDNGLYRLHKILRVPDWTRGTQPPLVRPGLQISAGDYVLAVNGRQITTEHNIFSYFQDLANQQVTLLVNDRPTNKGATEITVTTTNNEFVLRYLDWVEHNRLLVDKLSGGTIGYLHLPDTYMGSAREFGRQFYGQTRKLGLVVDGRFNNGGLDPDIFLQRLDKPVHTYWTRRHSHHQTSPATVTRAHLVCITNRQAGSGGDMLPYEFRLRGMGPIVGTRSWGGLVGVSQFLRLIDGGGLTAPDYRIYNREGNWVVENEGVAPDIEVELNSVDMAAGKDAQLLKAIELLQQKIEQEPRTWPQHEAFPVDR